MLAVTAPLLVLTPACSDADAPQTAPLSAPEEGAPARAAREAAGLLREIADEHRARHPAWARWRGAAPDEAAIGDALPERARIATLEWLDRLEALPELPQRSAEGLAVRQTHGMFQDVATLQAAPHGVPGPGAARPYAMLPLADAFGPQRQALLDRKVADEQSAALWVRDAADLQAALERARIALELEAATGGLPPLALLQTAAGDLADGAVSGGLVERFDAALSEGLDEVVVEPGSEPAPPGQTAETDAEPSVEAEREAALAAAAQEAAPWRRDARAAVRNIEAAEAALAATLQAVAADARQRSPGVVALPGGAAWYENALKLYLGEEADAGGIMARARRSAAQTAAARPSRQPLPALTGDAGSAGAGFDTAAGGEAAAPPPPFKWLAEEEGQMAPAPRAAKPDAPPQVPNGAARPAQASTADELASVLLARPPADQPRLAEALAGQRTPLILRPHSGTGSSEIHQSEAFTRLAPDVREALLLRMRAAGQHVLYATPGQDGAAPPTTTDSVSVLLGAPGTEAAWGQYAARAAERLATSDGAAREAALAVRSMEAALAVCDVGLNALGWSWLEAQRYLEGVTGMPEALASDLLLDLLARPGLAAAGWEGGQRLSRLHEQARRSLGRRFDQAAFHHVIVSGGPRRLPFIEEDVTAWIGAQLPDD